MQNVYVCRSQFPIESSSLVLKRSVGNRVQSQRDFRGPIIWCCSGQGWGLILLNVQLIEVVSEHVNPAITQGSAKSLPGKSYGSMSWKIGQGCCSGTGKIRHEILYDKKVE